MRNNRGNFKRTRQAGFTIIELMIVLVIIGGIVGIVAVNMGGQEEQANARLADTQLTTLMQKVQIFRADAKRYPNNIKELTLSKGNKPSDVKKFFGPYTTAEALVDPWGNDIVLRKGNGGKPELVSYGADGKSGGDGADADIVVGL